MNLFLGSMKEKFFERTHSGENGKHTVRVPDKQFGT